MLGLGIGKHHTVVIADLVQKIATEVSNERGVVCAVDCLRQYNEGGTRLLKRTIAVWEQWLDNRGGPQSDAHRHGAWVPSIPLEA